MPSRRTLLAAVGSAGTAALTGCSLLDGMPDGMGLAVGSPDPTPGPAPAVIAWADLTDPEHDLLEQAFDGGYRTCNGVPGAADRFADRLDDIEVYLRRDGDLYGIWLAITDMLLADTTEPPEGECGPFYRPVRSRSRTKSGSSEKPARARAASETWLTRSGTSMRVSVAP